MVLKVNCRRFPMLTCCCLLQKQATDNMITQNASNVPQLRVLFKTLYLLTEIYHDLNCHDIPEFFVTHLKTFLDLLLKYFVYENAQLIGDVSTGPGKNWRKIHETGHLICPNFHFPRTRIHLAPFSRSRHQSVKSWIFIASATRRISVRPCQHLSRHHGPC